MPLNRDFFLIAIAVLCCQRTFELYIAQKNETWLRRNNAIEFGSRHYRFIIILHVCFILSLIIEGWKNGPSLISWWPTPAMLLLCSQILRYWCIISLGKLWNTKILVIPGMKRIRNGPYRFMPHPNYLVVVLEFLLLPLLFASWFTLVWASTANAFILSKRIKQEEEALASLI